MTQNCLLFCSLFSTSSKAGAFYDGDDFLNTSKIYTITAEPDEINIDRRELAARLKTDASFENDLLEMCRKRLLSVIDYRCAYIRTDIDLSQENICKFGFMDIPSRLLCRNLSGCSEAFVFALTTGIATDRLLARLNMLSQAEHFMTDALASAAAESFCDYISMKLGQGLSCAPRYSPGYGDVSISFQRPLLDRLNAGQLLGINLNEAYLMTPVKSITAIMGIRNN